MYIFQYSKLHINTMLLSMLVLICCGTVHTSNGDILIKKEPSTFARFLNVTVKPINSGTSISGILERKKKRK